MLDLLTAGGELRVQLRENTRYFRERMTALGFDILPGEHPIIPVMLGDAKVAGEMAERLLAEGIYVVAFSYPVVPQGRARIRTQMSAAHTRGDLEFAVDRFARVKAAMGL